VNNFNSNIINNMLIHYSGLMKEGTKDFGNDFMSESIFRDIDTDRNRELSQSEIDKAKPKLIEYIQKVLQKDSFYAELHFDSEYTENLKQIDKSSAKTASEQIIQNNLNKAIKLIYDYAKNHPDDLVVQKYAQKLKEIISNGNLKLVDIADKGVGGRANKNPDGTDEILIENHDNISNLSVDYLLETLLHELRHTMETDNINSKAEELEAEETARELQKKISGNVIFKNNINDFTKGYVGYAEASPGTYKIPLNTGIAVWYKPLEVAMGENNELVIKSDLQKDMGNVYIEDHVQFGDKKDNEGNPLPISAKCIIKDSEGNVVQEYDYGNYDEQTRRFDYHSIHFKQIKLKNNNTNFTNFGFGI